MATKSATSVHGLALAPGRLHAQPGEVLHHWVRGDGVVWLTYRKSRTVRVLRRQETSTGSRRVYCRKFQIMERVVKGRMVCIGDEGTDEDYVWTFDGEFPVEHPVD